MARSEARVATDRPHRYAKQLASHLSRRLETEWDQESGKGWIVFPYGRGELVAQEGALLLSVEGEDDALERLEDVVGRHLVRFGSKDELVAEWHRDNGTPGSVHRKLEDPDEH